MSMSPLLGEQQPAGVSTAESECSGSSKRSAADVMDGKVENEDPPVDSIVELKPSAKPPSAPASPTSTSPRDSPRSSLKRIFSNPLPKKVPATHVDDKRRHTVDSTAKNFLGLSSSSSSHLCDSAPTIIIHAAPDAIESKPIRSIMTSRTLHESLHRGGRKIPRAGSLTFGHVSIREYERILGDNPSVTSGPPLSIGWRYAPEPIKLDVETFESGKGLPRASSEFLVPKAVREKILREHADTSRRDIAAAVRNIQKQKQQRRNTVVNIPMAGTQEKIEKVRRGMQKVIGTRTSYTKEEARLWDEAHAVAMEKARRLEESVRNGQTLSMREVYKVGTPWNNVVPSMSNSLRDENGAQYSNQEPCKSESCPALTEKADAPNQLGQLPSALYKPSSRQQHQRRVSIGDSTVLDKSEKLITSHDKMTGSKQNFRHSDSDIAFHTTRKNSKLEIVASENDVDDIFAKLILDGSEKDGGENKKLSLGD